MSFKFKYNLEDHPKSVTQVNAFLRENGNSLRLVNGGGYFYWTDTDDFLVDTPSVYVFSVSQLTFSQWLSLARG